MPSFSVDGRADNLGGVTLKLEADLDDEGARVEVGSTTVSVLRTRQSLVRVGLAGSEDIAAL